MNFIHKPYYFEKLESITGDNGRHYITPTGENYPSVTTMLSILSKDSISRWKERVGEKEAERVGKIGRDRGTEIHLLLEDYLKSKEKNSSNTITQAIYESMKPVIYASVSVVHNQEFNVYSNKLRCAGSADLLAVWNNKLSLIDFKTSKEPKREEWILSYFIQTTLYCLCIYELLNLIVPQIVILIGVENNLPQLFIKKTTDYIEIAQNFVEKYYASTME